VAVLGTVVFLSRRILRREKFEHLTGE